MTPVDFVSAAAIKKGLAKIVDDIYGIGKTQFSQKLKKWKAAHAQKMLAAKFRSVRMVKTIWQIDKEVDLIEFYYPSRILVDQKRLTINDIDDFPYSGNIIVQGTVGQGKSILFRYLTSRELVNGRAIPLFVELRRLKENQSLTSHLVTELVALGIDADQEVLFFLAKEGKLTIFLDAFDEVKEAYRSNLIDELEQLLRRFEKLRVFISSRPNSGIANSPLFRVFQLAPLEADEYQAVVRRLTRPSSIATSIIEGVRKAGSTVIQVLDTPLMVALLVFRFNVDQSIPENTAAFYDDLFDLLLRRHDRSKAGYLRPRKSGAGDAKLHELFNATCYLTRKAEMGAFSFSRLQGFVQEAIQMEDRTLDAAAVLEDFIEITCLILEEGGECKFLHRSIQEFYSARFIQTRPDELAIKFYESVKHRWQEWNGELNFLEYIDRYRFLKYFYIPEARRALKLTSNVAASEFKINPDVIRDFGRSIRLRFGPKQKGEVRLEFRPTCWPLYKVSTDWFDRFLHLLPSLITEVSEAHRDKRMIHSSQEAFQGGIVWMTRLSGIRGSSNVDFNGTMDYFLGQTRSQAALIDSYSSPLLQLCNDLCLAEAEIGRFTKSVSLFEV